MADTLAQLITKLKSLLMGNVIFTDAICTSAIRQALLTLNQAVPANAAETLDAVSQQYEYELDIPNADLIVDVLRQGTDLYKDQNISLNFDFYFEDDRPFFRLHTPENNGTTLIVRYTLPYTINGLDGETDSTLPAAYDVVLLDGASWRACLLRPSVS
jgi:hypothetical protein